MNRLRAALVLLLGLVLAAGMVLAGYWQLEVYRRQGAEAAAARAAEPARALADVAPVGQPVQNGYGRTVTATGRYEPEYELRIGLPDQPGVARFVSLFRTDDGRAVAVVRGQLAGLDPLLPPPPGAPEVRGVLLPSETETAATAGLDYGSVRIPQLAQRWPGPLVDGYIVLAPEAAQAQGLNPASAALPEGRGRLRNGAYAMQWWLFAAFAVVMAVRIARDTTRATPVADPAGDPGPD